MSKDNKVCESISEYDQMSVRPGTIIFVTRIHPDGVSIKKSVIRGGISGGTKKSRNGFLSSTDLQKYLK